jgi:hypothetical protein
MIIHFFIIFSILTFLFAVLHAILSIVFKFEFKFFDKTLKGIKNSVLTPIIFFLIIFFLFLILYSLSKTDSYLNSFNKITSKGISIGALGDFFNGLIAPTVSIVSIIYLWKAFVQQYKANQMLYSFEIERSFKSDIDWLRISSKDIEKLEYELVKKNNDELKVFLSTSENYQIRKSLYIINTFESLYSKLKEKRTKENNLFDIENEVLLILNSLYLPSLKTIFRTFTNYINNMTEEEKENLDMKNIEIQFLNRFSSFYINSPNLPKDKLFEGNLKIANEIIN